MWHVNDTFRWNKTNVGCFSATSQLLTDTLHCRKWQMWEEIATFKLISTATDFCDNSRPQTMLTSGQWKSYKVDIRAARVRGRMYGHGHSIIVIVWWPRSYNWGAGLGETQRGRGDGIISGILPLPPCYPGLQPSWSEMSGWWQMSPGVWRIYIEIPGLWGSGGWRHHWETRRKR